ncbi:MAG TPA: DUF3175 domain-containing protein [Candidatus Dormibacteraeota bacterium]|nr:DUF3175 domain-containing protein [Candidatus Dormibacteraeota bacterium]
MRKRTRTRCTFMANRRWSRDVTENSNALDLESNVFNKESPRAIAQSLKRSAEHSRRRKSSPYRSAMSMLTFYINRAGMNLPKERRQRLEKAKDELRELYGRKSKT